MKKLLLLTLSTLLFCSPVYAKTESDSNDAQSVVLYGKTSSGGIVPINVGSDGSIFGAGISPSGSDGVGSDDGYIRIYSRDLQYDNAFDINLEEYKTISLESIGEATNLSWDATFLSNRLLVGGVKRISGTDVLSKAVAYYHLDETSGTVVTDSVGTNHGAPLTGDLSTLAGIGKIGGGMRFRNTDNMNINLGSGTVKIGAADFTVCFMGRAWRTNESSHERILGSRLASGAQTGYEFGNLNGTSTVDSGFSNPVRFAVDDGAGFITVQGTTAFDDGQWHFICGRRATATIELLFDGAVDGTPSGTSSGDIATLAGNTYLGGTPLTPGEFSGDLDEVMMFDEALSDAEILALCNLVGGRCLGTGGLVTESASVPNIFSSTENETSVHGLTDVNDVIIGDKLEVQGQVWVNSPTAQTIAAGNTIAADACGSNKWITSSGAVATDTTNSFTAPTAVLGDCCMRVVNVGSNAITIDENANNFLAGAADVVLGAGDSVSVCQYWNGSAGFWYQIGATGNN